MRPTRFSSRWLGRIGYAEALALQEEIVARKIAEPALPDKLLLLEHEPVYTIGRTPDQSSLRSAASLPHPVIQVSRGGQATYHGPGQLVGYPLIDLRSAGRICIATSGHWRKVLIISLARWNVQADRRDGLTGVWISNRKIASIGVGVRRWISLHGFALNVCGDLAPFQEITPCGIAGVEMTSLAQELGTPVTVEQTADEVERVFQEQFAELLPASVP
jgi:lipoyl(octanoyl) transferase